MKKDKHRHIQAQTKTCFQCKWNAQLNLTVSSCVSACRRPPPRHQSSCQHQSQRRERQPPRVCDQQRGAHVRVCHSGKGRVCTSKWEFRGDWMFLLLMEDVFAPVIQIIETISAVDKDEMGHRQHFTFSLAPEVAHNHNFSIKDNRGKPFDSYFGLFTHPPCRIFLLLRRRSRRHPPFAEIRSKRDQMEARNTRGEQQVLWISHTHMHTRPAGCINCSGVSVRLYIFLWGPADWIKRRDCCEGSERKEF